MDDLYFICIQDLYVTSHLERWLIYVWSVIYFSIIIIIIIIVFLEGITLDYSFCAVIRQCVKLVIASMK